jgi:DNA helicase-2/ATP-dependent DNA helicase PcrA
VRRSKKKDIELYLLKAGAPALKGAHALYDEQSGMICCEEVDDPGERALLIAHEIGHASVHTGSSSCAASDIDASSSTESTPIGLQRVEDYGVRERRELQANVFAREFVLPRSLAYRLYVDEAMGASAIAERLGLPKNLVRQQLFDALLLPPSTAIVDEATTTARPLRPDPSQERAANHRGSPFQLQAGPGTGKTRTLVKTVIKLIEEDVHPTSILILTFSNRAAGELSERIAKVAPDAAKRIWISTFHAFGLDLLRRYHERLGLPAKPILFDKSDAIAILEELLPTLPLVHYRNLWDPAMELRNLIAAFSRAKDELADPSRYRELAEDMLRKAGPDAERVAAEKCLEVAKVYEHYEVALKNHGAIDFGDLIMRPALLLESDVTLQAEVRLRHRHVLVDEYQDVNRASSRLLKALTGDGKRLWVVGDARQSIYRFRGASSVNMVAFSKEFPNAKADQLGISYRSTDEIVKLVVAIAPSMGASGGMLALDLASERGPGQGRSQIRRYETLDDEVEGLAASVLELRDRGVGLRDQAILCRTNARLNEIASALELRGIPVLHLGSLFERDEVRDLLSLLSLAVDPFGDGLVRIGAMPRYGLTLQDVYLATNWIRTSGRSALEVLSELSRIPGLTPKGSSGLAQLALDFDGVRIATAGWELLSNYLLDRTSLLREKIGSETIADRMRAVAIWQFLNFVREQTPARSGLPIKQILDRVRQLVLLSEERDLRQVPAAALHMDAVRIMTVHGSKGLEFEAVHVPGLTVASFPSSNRGQRCPPPIGMIDGAEGVSVSEEASRAQKHEEECLFFVAVSRARSNLILYLASKQRNGNNRNESPFLSWLPSSLVEEILKPAGLALPPDSPRPFPIKLSNSDAVHVTDRELQSYSKCPRRYFYTHILGLGGARKSTAFSLTHDCLYKLIGWLTKARIEGEPTLEAAEAAFEEIWQASGPKTHGFAPDYRRLASKIVSALVRAGAGRRFRNAEPLAIDLPGGRLVVEPHEMAEMPDGSVILRRVNTGRKRSEEYDRLEYTLYHLAGEASFGKSYRVEAIHLTDDAIEVVTITPQKKKARKDKSSEMLASLAAGWFPTEINSVTCPRCPHFFICDAIPAGPLSLTSRK